MVNERISVPRERLYIVNELTMALTVKESSGGLETIVYEKGKKPFIVVQNMLTIMMNSCLEYGCSYEGRKAAAKVNAKFPHKPPVTVDGRMIYAFPTHADTHQKNSWIFLEHLHLDRHPIAVGKQTLITLSDDSTLLLPVSCGSLENQRDRAANLYAISYFALDDIKSETSPVYVKHKSMELKELAVSLYALEKKGGYGA